MQKVLDHHNDIGWNVAQFQWNTTKEGVFKNILVFSITILSMGFFSYWTGFSIIFERNGDLNKNQKSLDLEKNNLKTVSEVDTSNLFD